MMEHKHLIVRAEVTNPPKDPAFIAQWLESIITGIGMKLAVGPQANPISYYCAIPGNEGLTGVAILETSHCAIHVWDDVSPAVVQFDLYTCSALDPEQIFPYLDQFNVVKMEWGYLDREHGLNFMEIAGRRMPPAKEAA